MIDLKQYLAGKKLAGRDDLVLLPDALGEIDEEYIVLIIPVSEWKTIKEERSE